MTINYVARKVNLKDNFKERAERKLKKFERIFSENATVNIIVTLFKNRQTVEVTVTDGSMVYRAESTCAEMNDALDKVVDILGRQIRKNKTRLEKRLKTTFVDFNENFYSADEEEEDNTLTNYNVLRTKAIMLKPMTVDEAILRMNMINHKFFMFLNADDNEINVVYSRDDGHYGLLQPDV